MLETMKLSGDGEASSYPYLHSNSTLGLRIFPSDQFESIGVKRVIPSGRRSFGPAMIREKLKDCGFSNIVYKPSKTSNFNCLIEVQEAGSPISQAMLMPVFVDTTMPLPTSLLNYCAMLLIHWNAESAPKVFDGFTYEGHPTSLHLVKTIPSNVGPGFYLATNGKFKFVRPDPVIEPSVRRPSRAGRRGNRGGRGREGRESFSSLVLANRSKHVYS